MSPVLASHAEGFHLRVLLEPCLNLSVHRAPDDVRLPTLKNGAVAFDTSKLIQFETLPLDDLTPIIAKSAPLQQEINKALLESNKEQGDVRCLGMRFPGQWKNLGGLRVSPYTCDFGAK